MRGEGWRNERRGVGEGYEDSGELRKGMNERGEKVE